MDFQYADELAENVQDCLQNFEQKVKSADKTGKLTKICSKLSKVYKNLANIRKELADKEIDAGGGISTTNVEDWKDIAIKVLPEGASLGMVSDVEAALDQFKSVY